MPSPMDRFMAVILGKKNSGQRERERESAGVGMSEMWCSVSKVQSREGEFLETSKSPKVVSLD